MWDSIELTRGATTRKTLTSVTHLKTQRMRVLCNRDRSHAHQRHHSATAAETQYIALPVHVAGRTVSLIRIGHRSVPSQAVRKV